MKSSILLILVVSAILTTTFAKDYYKILGVAENASEKEIEEAYRELVLTYGNNKSPTNREGKKELMEVSEAFSVLQDQEKRAEYDEFMKYIKDGFRHDHDHDSSDFQDHNEHHSIHRPSLKEEQKELLRPYFGQSSLGNLSPSFNSVRPTLWSLRGQPRARIDLYDTKSGIQDLTEQTFPNEKSNKIWLVQFYNILSVDSWDFIEEFVLLREELSDLIELGAVNCAREFKFCKKLRVSKFPTLQLVSGGQSKEYIGDFSVNNVAQFVADSSSSKIRNLPTLGSAKSFINSKECKQSICVIYFSDEIDNSLLMKSISYKYNDRVTFGGVTVNNQAISNYFLVTEYPKILIFCNGNYEQWGTYSGEMTHHKLSNFFDQFRNSQFCSKFRDFYGSDFLNNFKNRNYEDMTLSELMNLLVMYGEPCSDCVTKSDFVEKVELMTFNT